MNIHHYKVRIIKNSIKPYWYNGKDVTTFVSPVTKNKVQKLYVIKHNNEMIYAGITSQSVSNRLRYGITANGNKGYHGYMWKDLNKGESLDILIWLFEDMKRIEVESIEAELVYLYRKEKGRWLEYQQEIHFHNSGEDVQGTAEDIFKIINKNDGSS